MISFPKKIEEIGKGEFRAGGTDLQERRHKKISGGPLVDLRDLPGFDKIESSASGLRIGAKVTIETIGRGSPELNAYPGLVQTASALATPQIRRVATLGGNLLQRVRCWYYRNPDAVCLKKGGTSCLAREGDHAFHSCIDLGPCIAPHASSMGLAMLVYEAGIDIGEKTISAEELFGDGSDPTRENTLAPGTFLRAVQMPPPTPNERAAYLRAISRARAEWPLVEVLVRFMVDGTQIKGARVALGGVANIPMRSKAAEAALEGQRATPETFTLAGEAAIKGLSTKLDTAYKLPMIATIIEDALQKAMS